MEDFLQMILKASLSGSILILAVLSFRLMLRQAPRKLICLLWLLAGLRLVMPFEIESSFSLQPRPEQVPQAILAEEFTPVFEEPVLNEESEQEVPAQTAQLPEKPVQTVPVAGAQSAPYIPKRTVSWQELLPWIYLAGLVGMVLVYAVQYCKLKRRVREAWRAEDGCWEAENIDTAFILGFLSARIYLPSNAVERERGFLLQHEKTHLKLKHHWFKLIGYGILSLHWFNPVVWLGYSMMCRDIEQACDEQVIRDMTLPQRKEYSETLLNFCTKQKALAAYPIAFGDTDPKKRVMSVLKYKKPGFWITAIGCSVIAFVAICFLTNPKEKLSAEQIPKLSYVESNYALRVNEQFNPNTTFDGKTLDHESEVAVYRFDPTVSEDARNAFVFYGDAFISRWAPEEKPQIVILQDYDGSWVSGNRLYIGSDPDSLGYGAKLISLLCGGYANYGAAYGYADYIASAEGWKETEKEAPALTENAARDMNWLCFRDGFVSDREIEVNKAAAACFTRDYIAANGEDAYRDLLLCSGSTDRCEDFSQVLSDWYAARGLDYMPSTILYGIGGEYHDYLVNCPYAEFVLPKEFDNGFVSDLTRDDDFLHRSYEETKYCFETNVAQMEYLREFIGFDDYKDNLIVELNSTGALSTLKPYHTRMILNSIEDLPILYVYWLADFHLRDPAQRSFPMYAGMAHHISLSCPNVYKEHMLRHAGEHGWTPEMYQQGDWNELYVQMLEGVEDPYTIQATRFHFGTYYFDDYKDDPGMGMFCSFPWYLIDKYGFDAMFDYVYTTDAVPMELDMAAEKQAWMAWIEETYAGYPKYSDYLREQSGETLPVCWEDGCTDPHHDHSGRDCTDTYCTDSSHHHTQNSSGHHDDGHHHSH